VTALSHREVRFAAQRRSGLRSFPRQGPTASPGLRLEHGLLQLGQPPGLLSLHPAVLLPPAVIRRLRHLDDAADLDNGLALCDQLLGALELADDLLRRMPGAFHG